MLVFVNHLWVISHYEFIRKKSFEKILLWCKKSSILSQCYKIISSFKKDYPIQFTLKFIKECLGKQYSYFLQRQAHHRLETAQVLVSHINEMWDIDQLSMDNLSKDSDGIRLLCALLTCFLESYGFRPLKDKTAISVLKAMKDIMKDTKL